jgi:hypothetical protein
MALPHLLARVVPAPEQPSPIAVEQANQKTLNKLLNSLKDSVFPHKESWEVKHTGKARLSKPFGCPYYVNPHFPSVKLRSKRDVFEFYQNDMVVKKVGLSSALLNRLFSLANFQLFFLTAQETRRCTTSKEEEAC